MCGAFLFFILIPLYDDERNDKLSVCVCVVFVVSRDRCGRLSGAGAQIIMMQKLAACVNRTFRIQSNVIGQ